MSNEEVVGTPVEPLSEQVVKFYEDEIPVAQLSEGRVYVPVAPIAEALGLTTHGQRNRVLRDEVMAEDVLNINLHGTDGRRRAMLCIPLPQLPGFLFGVDISRVRVELRDKLIRYKRECFNVLWQATIGGQPQLPAPATPSLPAGEQSRAEETLQYVAALYELAAGQVEQERRLAGLEEQHQTIADYVRGFIQQTRSRLTDHEGRINALEERHVTLTDAEATEISIAVKNLAYELERRGTQDGYGRVYGALYRRFGVRSYPLLPYSKYEAVLKWLRDWYDETVAKPPTKELASGDGDVQL